MDKPFLEQRECGLTLVGGELSLCVDFRDSLKRIKHNNLTHEMVVKAVNIKSHVGELNVIDTTAGLGEDSFLLAAAGFRVTLYEYNSVICALLRDGISRALSDPDLYEVASRMTLIEGDSIQALKNLSTPPDVIYLDPMFPARQKSGMIKKKFQLLQQLESPCMDEDGLLSAAIGARPKRIVIKRPAKGPNLSNVKPSYTIAGNSIRYDCIVL